MELPSALLLIILMTQIRGNENPLLFIIIGLSTVLLCIVLIRDFINRDLVQVDGQQFTIRVGAYKKHNFEISNLESMKTEHGISGFTRNLVIYKKMAVFLD
jgi:hypothetical protein